MADLTSKEWRDLVFEGKNKEFGAYDLRKKSEKRHTLAVIFTLIALGLIILGIATWDSYKDIFSSKEELVDEREEMDDTALPVDMEEETPDEEIPDMDIPEPEPEEIPPEINQYKDTQLTVGKSEDVKEAILDNDKLQEEQGVAGLVTTEGTEDAFNVDAFKQQVEVPKEAPKAEKPQPEKIFEAVEQPAEFPGGMSALMKWLSSNIRYPESAQQNGVEGRVIVRFVVEKDGSISNVTVLKGVDRDLDQEAVRVVKRMPKWQAGKNNGQAVRAYFTLPVQFKLANQ